MKKFDHLPFPIEDLTGRKFGILTVIGQPTREKISSQTRTAWLCQCDCGRQKRVLANNLKRGNTKPK